jgi:hypothetical protein
VVSDEEKASYEASGRDQEDDHCGSVEIDSDGIETGVSIGSRDRSDGCPFTGQVVSGIEVT